MFVMSHVEKPCSVARIAGDSFRHPNREKPNWFFTWDQLIGGKNHFEVYDESTLHTHCSALCW